MLENREKLNGIIKNGLLTSIFQPIADLKDAHIIGYEILSRGPKGDDWFSPMRLIEIAEQEGMRLELEKAFISKAKENICKHRDEEITWFVNMDPNIIAKEDIEYDCITNNNIVFELTEHNAIDDVQALVLKIEELRDKGYKIAIDDVGAGYAGYESMSFMHPNYIKIDKAIIQNIEEDTYKQAIVASFVSFAQLTGSCVIAEGIENSEQLKALIKLEVNAGQGYYLQKPMEELSELDSSIKQQIQQYNYQFNVHLFRGKNEIGIIAEKNKTFDYKKPAMDVKTYLESSKLEGVCVTRKDIPMGLVMKTHLDAIMSLKYGYSVFSHRPVHKIMDSKCMIVDYHNTIEEVAQLAMARSDKKIYDNIIVVKNLKYYGTVTIIKLLQFLNDSERHRALQSNPLTGLPGNNQIEREIYQAMNSDEACCLLYFDLDNFKPYNDTYGFSNGDDMIKMTGEIISKCVKSRGETSFVGHLGGDDFVCIIYASYGMCGALCEQILMKFEQSAISLFKPKDRERGYYIGKGRDEVERQYPIMSLSIAGLHGYFNQFNQKKVITKRVSNIKSKAKKVKGNHYIIESVSDCFKCKLV